VFWTTLDAIGPAWLRSSFGYDNQQPTLMKNFPLKSLQSVVLAIFLSTLCFSSRGEVVVWGDNQVGQTNVPPSATNVLALAGGDGHGLALKSDGTVVAWGWNLWGQTNVPIDLTNVVGIAAGSRHSLALKKDGGVALWGAFIL
jgi:alpha-tubulin suppressor-like RCC1 family protein